MIWVIINSTPTLRAKFGRAEEKPMGGYNYSVEGKDNIGITAPFTGWSPERQKRVDNFNLQYALKKLPSLLATWNSVRPILNEYYEKNGKEAVCTRLRMKGKRCFGEHPLNAKILEYKARFESSFDPWDFVFLEDYIDDAVRLAKAIQDESYARKIKANLEPAKIAPPNPNALKKPFKWNDGIITPLDGTNWSNIAVAASGAYEYNPTIVEVGSADTLVAAFSVYPCNTWCAVTHTNECVVVARSIDQGNSWNLWFCIQNSSYNVGEPAIGEEDYRKILTVAYTSDFYYPDYDVGAFTFHVSNPFTFNTSTWVDVSADITITPYVNAEFNWGDPSCAGQWTTCACTALDNWWFIGMNKLSDALFPDQDGDGYRDAYGVKIARSTDCGATWSIVYNGPARNGSAYDNNQIMLETTNDPRGSSSVCNAADGGDNTIQAVYNWKNPASCTDPCNDNRIEHLFTDASGGWGNTWTSTTIYTHAYPINQPWLAVSRSLSTASTRSLVLFERQWSATDADIHGLYATGIPPLGWTWFSVDNSTVESRTPTVHTEARWQWCPGITATSADEFHAAFYHKCPNTFDGPLCSEPYTVYNNTFRVAVMKASWTSPTVWGPEYCGTIPADTISTPPPPSFSGGGLWQNWWQINGTTYKITPSAFGNWWFGALWVYNFSATDWDLYWTVLTCALAGDDELSVGENTKEHEGTIKVESRSVELRRKGEIYTLNGRLIFKGKGKVNLKPGAYFIKMDGKTQKVVIR